MTPAEERQQWRDVQLLKDQVARLQKEAYERDRWLGVAQDKILSLAACAGGAAIGVVVLGVCVAYDRTRGFWETAGVFFVAAVCLWWFHDHIKRALKDWPK